MRSLRIRTLGLALAAGLTLPISTGAQIGAPCAFEDLSELPRLIPDRTVSARLSKGDVKHYRIELPPDSFVRVEVDEAELDVELTLCSEDGSQLYERDSDRVPEIPQMLSILSEQEAHVVLAVSAGGDGRSEIRSTPVRPARPEDPQRLEAEDRQYQRMLDFFHGRWSEKLVEDFRNLAITWRDLGEPVQQAEALYWEASTLEELERWSEARASFERALPLWETTGIREREAETLDHLAEACDRTGDLRAAREHLKRATRLWREQGNPAEEARLASKLGELLYRQGDAFEARPHFERSVELRRALVEKNPEKYQKPLRRSLTGLGSVLSDLGEHGASLRRHQEAQQISEALGEETAAVLNNFAGALGAVGDYAEAQTYYLRALDLLQEDLNKPDTEEGEARELLTRRATTLNNLAWARVGQEDYEGALADFERALELSRELEDRALEAMVLTHIGRIESDLGRYDEGRETLHRALDLRRQLDRERGLLITLLDLGTLEQRTGRLKEARGHLEEALELADRKRHPANRARILTRLALVDGAEAKHEVGLQRSRQALDLMESLRDRVPRRDLQQTFSASKRYVYENHIHLLMQAAEGEDGSGEASLAAALETSEQARARGFLDLLREAEVDLYRGAPRELVEEERELRLRLNQAELYRGDDEKSPDEASDLEAEITTLVQELRDVRQKIRDRSPAYAALDPLGPTRLPDIQAYLAPDETLVELFLGSEHGYAWVVTAESLHGVSRPPRREIERVVRDFHRALAGIDKDAIRLAARLEDLVLRPLRKHLTGSRLIVIPDGPLHYVPFAALPMPGQLREETLLVDRFEIRYGASAGLLVHLRKHREARPRAPKTVAVLADPVFEADDRRLKKSSEPAPPQIPDALRLRGATRGDYARLPYSNREAKAILRHVDGNAAFRALGTDASRETLLGRDLSQFRILHLAAHGFADDRHPELSHLVLSLYDPKGRPVEGFVQLHDIYGLRLRADLVVLSACETGLGREILGEGLVGLTRGFFHSGASQVMASLWNVTDASTAALMEELYENLLTRSMSAPRALQQAQISLRKKRPYSHPSFWAAFVVQGDGGGR